MKSPDFNKAFNFSQFLMDINEVRLEKLAYIDDSNELSYGSLFSRARQFAAGLLAIGVRREERILLVLQDSNDWPVTFLGAIFAGIVPVAVNTLLTVDDYAYLMEHSRARVIVLSGTILPTINSALNIADHDIIQLVVSRPKSLLDSSAVEFEHLLSNNGEAITPARTRGDDAGFWLYTSGSTGRPKAAVHSHANPYWTANYYGHGVLQIKESDICFSAAKLFFAYGLGNALTFPLSAGATTLLMAERPTPDAVFKRLRGEVGRVKPTVFFGAPTGFAGMLAAPNLPKRSEVGLRLVSSAGEALPAELGKQFSRRFDVDVVDGIGSTKMLHIFMSNKRL